MGTSQASFIRSSFTRKKHVASASLSLTGFYSVHSFAYASEKVHLVNAVQTRLSTEAFVFLMITDAAVALIMLLFHCFYYVMKADMRVIQHLHVCEGHVEQYFRLYCVNK